MLLPERRFRATTCWMAYASLAEELDAMTRNSELTAVSNNSWGNPDRPWPKRASSLWEQAVDAGIKTGDGGRGTFYVFSAGNGHMAGDDSNLDEYVNYYGVTAACSVQGRGARAPYSEMGANLWVCAPSNERPGIFRTRRQIWNCYNRELRQLCERLWGNFRRRSYRLGCCRAYAQRESRT